MHSLGRISIALFLAAVLSYSQGLDYPVTRKIEHADEYHGVKVPDPYRWLEDDKSAETAAWVAAQNKVTFDYLSKIPFRDAVRKRLERLFNYPRYNAPFRRGDLFFFYKNDGLQNQAVLYVQKGLNGTPEVLLDPNAWSADGTTRLGVFSLSKDGRYAVYGVSKGGSDWQEYRVLEVATKRVLEDRLEWVKVSGVGWWGDRFFYSRYPAPADGRVLSAKNENHMVYLHKVGTAQSDDVLVYAAPEHPQRFHGVSTTEDERFAILNVSERGKGKKGNAIWYRDLAKADSKFVPIVEQISDDSFGVVKNVGERMLIRSDHGAKNGKVVSFDLRTKAWQDVLPEKPQPLQRVSVAGGKLFAAYLENVTTRAYVYSLDGKLENEISLPERGTANGFGGRQDDDFVFYTFTSNNFPPTIYRYVIKDRKSMLFRAPDIPGYNPANYVTKQATATSKDGTKIPVFLVHRKDLKLDGKNPALLYGYGGFNISVTPSFSPLRLALLEQGFVYASANMRGGSEYGEAWHEAGTKLKKQNVFDDFVAAAEWLIENKYTSPEKLAVQGGSNGGLLVGAVINQRPELFRAAIPQVGVMDMLRFHKFTIGWNWIADYGSSDNDEEFKALFAYSPLHNVKPGTKYPAVLVTTADHDDRVVPAHSFKYAATMQEKASKERPVLIRIDTKSGHGASNTAKTIEQTADIYSFLFYHLGVDPRPGS
ncbi:MAG: prolyl oligopeptidase family serine peptidase [Bryobacteraceae bacterium]|nr:prolyl oligopeptidase family serine peptidase [Bryobacteraceae bacterium]